MKSFIAEVVSHLLENKTDLEKTTFIFPSKRAGRFLVQHLSGVFSKTIFLPEIYSIEEFVEKVSGLSPLDNTGAIFKLYETYRELTPKNELEAFDIFYNWSQTLIRDFNEIDRYLVDPNSFFNYLSNIQALEHWSKPKNQTELIKNYLAFWNRLPNYYHAFTEKLLEEKIAYQGLRYRVASEKTADFLSGQTNHFVFAGFNLLSPAEQKIIQPILDAKKGSIFWDIDEVFLQDKEHEAGYFINHHKNNWPGYQSGKMAFNWEGANYKAQKNIEIIGVPKNIGQAKQVGNLLSEFSPSELTKTALVLGDENLATPMLNSLPENVNGLNITLGLPLSQTPTAGLFDLLFKIHNAHATKFYYKNIVEILGHPAIESTLGENSSKITQKLYQGNQTYLTLKEIMGLVSAKKSEVLEICFANYREKPIYFLENLLRLTIKLKNKNTPVQNEALFHFSKLFQKLIASIQGKTPVKKIKTLEKIYQDSLQLVSLDYGGTPFQGLQMMGMLETRVLDFENVILTSVNEGVLPAGKGQASFIPFDLRKAYGLPTYKETDAVYSYHFYRLLQRAKNVYILYNSAPGDLNAGEKSRFITQLKIEKQPLHDIKEQTVAPKIPSLKNEPKQISKTPEILQKIKEQASCGFSPSALLTYVNNPFDFYKKYVLGIRETEEVEETVAANTLGSVIHDTLEELYKKKESYFLSAEDFDRMFQEFPGEIKRQFKEHYRSGELSTGKNRIVFEVAKRYVQNFLETEKKSLPENKIEIVSLEKEMKAQVQVGGIDFPVFLKGKADRIDRFNEKLRIIDYKTGRVKKTDVEIIDWETITKEYKHSKAFQVLCYAYLFQKEKPVSEMEAGIISFKNLQAGFLAFATKASSHDKKNKNPTITPAVLGLFEEQLKKLILEICDPEIDFVENEAAAF